MYLVIELGPLYQTSCFSFENLDEKLKNLVTGAYAPEIQTIKKIAFPIDKFDIIIRILPE